jgi:ribosomal protein S18 acetylase RimI-like enzyme
MCLDHADYARDGSGNIIKVTNPDTSFREIAEENRFSYQYSYIAKINSKPVGLMTCYPGNLSKKLVYPIIQSAIMIGKAHFIWHIVTHLKYFYYFASTVEAYSDEFYIGTLAVLPEYRSHGIGAKMIEFMKMTAKARGFAIYSLLVEADNMGGICFYERNGF